MLDASGPLRNAYLGLLAGVNISGTPIPIYDEQLPNPIPAGKLPPATIGAAKVYILVTNQTETDISPKCNFHQECSITIDIVTKYPVSQGGKKLSEEISNQVQQLIYPSPDGHNLDVGPYFNCYYVSKELSRGLTEFNMDSTVYRKLIVFTNKLEELTPVT